VQSDEIEPRRGHRPPCDLDQVAPVHAELARAVVADEAHPLEPGGLTGRYAEQHRHDALRPLGDRLEPGQLPSRLDGDGSHSRTHGLQQLVVALARPGEHDRASFDPRLGHGSELTGRCDVGTEAESSEVGDDGQRRIRLHRVRKIEDRRQDCSQGLQLAGDDVEVVHVQRRPEPGRQVLGLEASQPAGTKDLVPRGRPAAPRRRHFTKHAHRRAVSRATRAAVPP
jgi:hypothetical protein